MKRSIVPLIEQAVLLALASSCGTNGSQDQDAAAPDASVDQTVDGDAPDAGDASDDAMDASAVNDVTPLPLPDGCVVNGKPDGFAPCGYTEQLNDPTLCQVDQDADIQETGTCYVLCDPNEPDCTYYSVSVGEGGMEYLLSCGAGCIGRLHESARERAAGCCAPLRRSAGEYLAGAAELEAASVDSFEIVARDLERFGAPSGLASAARRAAEEETRHARAMTELARSFGCEPRDTAVPTMRERSLRAFAIDNAVEGCVRETFGAALAAWQASRARDARVREAMRTIAREEATHADLAWRIDAWLENTASDSDRRAMHAARRKAIEAFTAAIETYGTGDETLGLPSAADARTLLDALHDSLWSS